MKRNPYFKEWSAAAQPDGYPDEIVQSFGLTVEAQITAIQNGQADWTLEQPPADRLGRDRHEVREPGPRQHADRVLVRAHEHESGALQQREGASGGELRDRPQRCRQDLRRTEARGSVVPGAAPGLPRLQAVLPVHEEPGHDVVGARPGQGEGARQAVGNRRSEGGGPLVRRRGQQGDGGLPPERAQPDRLQGDREADLREHLLHLRAEHEEQGADQRAAVVPGLPGRIGLPLHPVRLRVVPPRQRLEHQHRGVLRQEDQRADAQGARSRRDGREHAQRAVVEDRQGW